MDEQQHYQIQHQVEHIQHLEDGIQIMKHLRMHIILRQQ